MTRIRFEKDGDEQAIHRLTVRAFEPMSFSDGTEAAIIDQLRKDGDLTVSLVAVERNQIVGHIAFSPVTIGGRHGGWYGLGPVSVRPDLQKKGIGSKLIREGLAQLKDRGAAGCALIGSPEYYSRFGFKSDGSLTYQDVSSRYVQWLSFGSSSASGLLNFAHAFEHQT